MFNQSSRVRRYKENRYVLDLNYIEYNKKNIKEAYRPREGGYWGDVDMT